MRIGICEPDAEYLDFLSRLLRQIRSINGATVVPYINSRWFVSDLSLRMEAFDILLVRREMDEYNGAFVAREAVRINPASQVILISDNNCILDEDYDIAHLFFLPKEHVPLRLVTVVDRAVSIIQKRNERYFGVQVNREKLRIPCSTVLYMEKMLRKTELVTAEKRYSTYQSPNELLDTAKTDIFVQCHRSYYVNLTQIYSIGPLEITIYNGAHLPIGNTYAKMLLEQYERYCSRLLSGST